MAKTSKERTAKHRSVKDPEKNAQDEKQKRSRWMTKVQNDPEKLKKFREQQTIRQRRRHQKLKDQENSPISVETAFSSSSTEKRSIVKARKALPLGTSQKLFVVSNLFACTINASPHKKGLIRQWVGKSVSSKGGRPKSMTSAQ